MACVSLLAYFSIEYFIDRQFESLHQQRVQRLEAQAVAALDEEKRYLARLATLIAGDSDLGNSVYYHLYLEGERKLPQGAVDRIAQTFGLGVVALDTTQGYSIARYGAVIPSETSGAGTRIVWLDNTAWLVTVRPLMRGPLQLARMEIAKPLLSRLKARLATDIESLRLSPRPPAGNGFFKLADQTYLEVQIANPAREALAEVRRLLLASMMLAAVSIMALTGWILIKRLRPLSDLVDAAGRVGRGEFALRLETEGNNEITRLVEAFNDMTARLSRAKENEASVEHEARLSAIGRVAARVAHDINNPLTVIGNTAQLMGRELDETSPLQADIRLILHHSARATETIRQLLEYGRALRPRPHEMDANQWLLEWAARWNRHGNHENTLNYVTTGLPTPVQLDSLLLEQMLDNIATNACQAGAPVTVELRASQGAIFIEIVDSGPGFSADDLPHLFEPFYTTKTSGTGLGLASALLIARAHGGDIEAFPGVPGRVRVRLPRNQARVEPDV